MQAAGIGAGGLDVRLVPVEHDDRLAALRQLAGDR